MLRWVHAWGWTALWLLLLGRIGQAFPVGLGSAAGMALLLTPGVYLPQVLAQREREPDLSGDLSAPLAVLLAGLFISFVLLGGFSLLGFWDKRPKGATVTGVAGAVLGLHLLAGLCIGLCERWLPSSADE